MIEGCDLEAASVDIEQTMMWCNGRATFKREGDGAASGFDSEMRVVLTRHFVLWSRIRIRLRAASGVDTSLWCSGRREDAEVEGVR